MQSLKIQKIDTLIEEISRDHEFCETFIRDISIGSPDMFRDPDFWIYFRDQLLPEVLKLFMYPEIIIPESVTGNELYSLAALLREANLDYRVDITVSCRNERIREQILNGTFSNTDFKNSLDNYEVFNPDSSFEQYLETRNENMCLRSGLLEGVDIRIETPDRIIFSEKTAVILYRNRMIYQDAGMQYKTLRHFLENMHEGTHLITGLQENIDGFGLEGLYSTVSDDLKIYKRINAD
jgi:chemotaxis protein methyltransferase CheR